MPHKQKKLLNTDRPNKIEFFDGVNEALHFNMNDNFLIVENTC